MISTTMNSGARMLAKRARIHTPAGKAEYSRKSKVAKKVILIAVMSMVLCVMSATPAFAIDESGFKSEASTAMQTVVSLIGAGLGIWGVVNLLEGYGNDNPGAKSQGIKQLVAGVGLIGLGTTLVPYLFK